MSENVASPQARVQRVNDPLQTLGNYELLHEIASGGMATVYLGRKRGIGGFERLVAIKCCHPHLRRDPAFVTMFLDEARLAARIHHPNVVATIEVSDDDALYFVMQYVEGMSLSDWLSRLLPQNQRIAEDLLLRVMIDGLAGLHAAHELRDHDGKSFQLVHRDVSPQNLLIGLDGVTRIADFGIAKAESRATRTRTGQVKGKTGYMPPEQILGEPLDRRADVYAAGVVLWEALVGRRLFDGESDAATINQVLNNAVPAPSTVTSCSIVFDDIVRRALQFQPGDRYATAEQFAQALEETGLTVANHRAVGEAVGELCRDQVACLRSETRRDSAVEIAATAVPVVPAKTSDAISPGSRRATLGWLAACILGVTLLVAGLWALRLHHPAASNAAPEVLTSVAIVPAQAPSSSAAPPTPPATSASGSSEPFVRRPTKVQRLKPSASITAHPTSETAPRANTEAVTPTPPPVASSAPVRPRAKPSEFRPADL
jgi:serine/threonine-protein kinase